MIQNALFGASKGSLRRRLFYGCLLILMTTGTNSAQAQCLPPVFNSPPSSITAYTTANTCSPVVSFLARLLDSTGVSFSFALSGATTDAGVGTGTGHIFNRGVTHVAITAKKACDSTKHFFDITVKDTFKPKFNPLANITAYAGPNQCGANVPYSVSFTDNCPACTHDLLIASGFKLLGNFQGHSYYTTPLKSNFDLVNAQASLFGAHLVSINSKAEDSFIAAVLPDTQLAWIGFTDRDVEGVWKWTDGSPVTYTNWCNLQPDDYFGGQDWAILNSGGLSGAVGCWDDAHSPVFPGNGQPNNFVGIVELDICGTSLVRTRGIDSGGFFPIGTTNVAFRAMDASGNIDSISFNVTVLDTIKPVLSPLSNITAYAGANCCANVSYRRPTATDNCTGCNFDLLTSLGFKLLGTYQGHYYFTTPLKSNFDAVHAQALSVVSAHLVSIGSAGEDSFIAAVLPDTQLAWIGFTDRDAEGVWKWTDGSPVTYTNWCQNQPDDFLGNQDWAVLNSAVPGQTGRCWDDAHSPVFPGNGQPNNFVGIVELDGCGPTVVRTNGLDSGACFPIGTTQVSFRARDAFGNESVASFNVTVLDTIKPKFTAVPNITVFAKPKDCGANVSYHINVTDNCPGCNHGLLTSLGFKSLGTFQGHSYFTTPLKSNFDLVNAQALSVLGGHLVSMNSKAEDSFVNAMVPDTQVAWIGFTDRDVEGVWKWTDGSPVTYTNWCNLQPDDFLVDQDWAILNSGGLPGPVGCWDDAHSPVFKGNGQPNNFVGVVELDTCTTVAVRTRGLASGAFFPRGTTTVTYKSMDAYGNVDSMTFTVTVIDTQCTTAFGNFETGNGGLTSNASEEVRVYPNPTTNTFFVELPYFEQSASVTLLDMQGRMLQSRKLSATDQRKQRFDLGSHPRGMYMLDVTYDDHRYRVRVIMR